ncbi:hypothetical protein Hanom_Chr04g00281721 [Helianthus anomalus]
MHWFKTANLGKYCYQSATYNNISVSNNEVHYGICFKQRILIRTQFQTATFRSSLFQSAMFRDKFRLLQEQAAFAGIWREVRCLKV